MVSRLNALSRYNEIKGTEYTLKSLGDYLVDRELGSVWRAYKKDLANRHIENTEIVEDEYEHK